MEYLDELLDEAVANFVRFLLAALGGDRKHPTYLRLFPVAPSPGTKGVATADPSTFVAGVLSNFDREKQLVSLTGQALQMRSALDTLDAARAGRTRIGAASSAADGRLNACIRAMVQVFNDAFHDLSLIYPGQKGLIRSFYFHSRYTRKADAAPDQE